MWSVDNYSGSVSEPFTLKLLAAVGAPVLGWPQPTDTLYAPAETIHCRKTSPIGQIQSRNLSGRAKFFSEDLEAFLVASKKKVSNGK